MNLIAVRPVRHITLLNQYGLSTFSLTSASSCMVMGGRSSVVRALAAQASDLGSIPSDFPVFFTFHLACVSIKHLVIYLPGYIEPSNIYDIACSNYTLFPSLLYTLAIIHTSIITACNTSRISNLSHVLLCRNFADSYTWPSFTHDLPKLV